MARAAFLAAVFVAAFPLSLLALLLGWGLSAATAQPPDQDRQQ